MSVILGYNAFHADSSACLVVDGQLLGAVSEERFGKRIKHDSDFPINSISYLLKTNNIKLKDVTHLAIPRNTNANKLAKLKYASLNPKSSIKAILQHRKRFKQSLLLRNQLNDLLNEDTSKISYNTVSVEHHLAHISSAYYLSPYESLTAGFSFDSSGDFVSMMAAECEGNKIKILDKIFLPNSLGFFYTAMCQFIGFDNFGEEYKVMGLAPYGNDTYSDIMKDLITADNKKWFELNRDFFGMHNGGESGKKDHNNNLVVDKIYTNNLKKLLGKPRIRSDEITQKEKDIAKSTQIRFEQITLNCMNYLQKLVPTSRLALAGGCALNGVSNTRILLDTPFKNQFIQPAASDDGTCLGAAYWVWHNIIGSKNRFTLKHSFWGPEHSEFEIKKIASNSKYLRKVFVKEDEFLDFAAKLIAEGNVVGWYQGKSEWGPRALGNRSILANPTIKSMKGIINQKIKKRESFRPFAPSVLSESVSKYFEQNVNSPFMQHVVKIRKEWRERLPSVTHVDGTGRLQTVDKKDNPLYYDLIKYISKYTGVEIVLNTSFNENEPIVDTPQQAYDCFIRTDMDVLFLGKYFFQKTAK